VGEEAGREGGKNEEGNGCTIARIRSITSEMRKKGEELLH